MVLRSWITQTGDYNGEGNSDLIWRDNVAMWNMNGVPLGSAASIADVGLNWTIQGMNAD